MKMKFTANEGKGQKKTPNILYRIITVILCVVMIGMDLGSPLVAFAATDDLNSIVEEEKNDELEVQTQEEAEAVYTLHLTHYLRFIVNGEGRNIQTQEILELSEADFENGLCDLSRFAYDAEQLTVTEAKPLSIDAFGENRESGARIVYAVSSGWQIAPIDKKGNDGVVLREVFQGDLSDYEFIPADVVTVTIDYQYSKTGGLFGVSPYAPETMQVLATKDGENYVFMVPIKSKPGFNIVLDPAPLDAYLNKQPPENATPEELHQMLNNGDFNGNITENEVYAYQEEMKDLTAKPDYSIINKEYSNIYSTKYNRDWNDARSLSVEGADGYEAIAVSGDLDQADENYGANALKDPKLKVILTKEQMENARKNNLTITVNYRRITTWYTVKHWVPESLSGMTQSEIDNLDSERKATVDHIAYVLLDSEYLQGRVGALTKAVAKSDGKVFGALAPMPFAQELINRVVSIGDLNQNDDDEENKPTIINIYYKEAETYRVIFKTDYAYIPRKQIPFGSSVDFGDVTKPERKGYIFDGWQYLKKDAVPDKLTGEYDDDDYEDVPKNGDSYTLKIDQALFNKAQFKTTDGVSALYLYPKWKVDKANITVVLWTEDLDGLSDVQALAKGGNVKADESDYYSQKYKNYKENVTPNLPVLNDITKPNNNYSNVGSFTMQVDTDSSLVDESDKLKTDIMSKVEETFNQSKRVDGSGATPIQFYNYYGFEVMHEHNGEMEYLKTANADGKTVVYVYYTRKIYTLKFHYYGRVKDHPFSVAAHTSGYSNGGEECYDEKGNLMFDYGSDINNSGNDWCSAASAEAINTPQTITVRAKYGADLRDIWPVSRPEEKIANENIVWGSSGSDVELISWATTLGKYRNDSQPGGIHENEATVMGLFASMDEEIIADPHDADQVHHLVAYWEKQYGASTYRYTHCYEVPGLDIDSAGIETVSLYDNSTALKDLLYLVPSDNEAFTKYGFRDLLPVSYDKETKKVEYSDYGQNNKTGYYAVRGYETEDEDHHPVIKYYAVARQIDTVSTNNIKSQHPSARAHMTKVNTVADHTSEYKDNQGSEWDWPKGTIGSTDDPYELYYYYDRDRYTITYRVPVNRSNTSETYKVLGHIELPYGAYITKDKYAFQLGYRDTNQEKTAAGEAKYLWIYPDGDPIQVCPDRNKNGVKEWKFKGWGLGPEGANMLWKFDTGVSEPQAQIDDDFYINSDLLVYAIWENPICNVTFHLNGGTEATFASSLDTTITVSLPANTKITETDAKIPRPFYSGYTMEGWYIADEDGNIQIPEVPFEFNDFVTDDMHVAIKWKAETVKDYSYKAYYVTDNPAKDDGAKEKIYINDDGQVVEGDTTGAKEYYILDIEEGSKACAPGTTINLPVREFVGYIPSETNKSMTLNEESSEYYVIFYYDSYAKYGKGSYIVRFVEAGTEYGEDMAVIQQNVVFADKAVLTPGKHDLEILENKGYQLVNRNDDGKTYTQITDYMTLKWLDSKGDAHPWSAILTDLLKEDAERTITYLVQPIEYTIAYQNADNSPGTADDALSAITAENTLAGNAGGKNPTRYTVKDRFTLKNPSRVYENGKWYQFSHWSLGDGIMVSEQDGKIYTKLTVERGTVGKLTFVANWVELTNIGNLKVSNTVSGNRGDTNQEFTFTVTLSNSSINGTYGDMTFIDGIATFKLKHGESVTGQAIPAGIGYEVKESDNEGYTVTSSAASGTIENGVTIVARFNNHNQNEGGLTDPTDSADSIEPDTDNKTNTVTNKSDNKDVIKDTGPVNTGVNENTAFLTFVAVFSLMGLGFAIKAKKKAVK